MPWLMSILLVFGLLVSKFQLTRCQQTCSVEDKASYTAYCSPYLQKGANFTWEVSTPEGQDLYRCTCEVGDCTTCPQTTSWDGTTYGVGTRHMGGEQYKVWLHLTKVGTNNNNATVVCSTGNGHRHTACERLVVYAKPSTPTCDVPEMTKDNTHVEFKCVTEKTFPQADVEVRFGIECESRVLNGKLRGNISTCEHNIVSKDPIYYRSQCRLSVPVNQLPRSSGCTKRTYDVYMHPVIGIDRKDYYSPNTSLALFDINPEMTTRSTTTANPTTTTATATTAATATATTATTATATTATATTATAAEAHESSVTEKTGNSDLVKGVFIGAGAAIGVVVIVIVVVGVVFRVRRRSPETEDGNTMPAYAGLELQRSSHIYEGIDNNASRPRLDPPLGENTGSSNPEDKTDFDDAGGIYEGETYLNVGAAMGN